MTYDEIVAQGVDPAKIPESEWWFEKFNDDKTIRYDRAWIVKPHGDNQGISVGRAINVYEEEILKMNEELYKTDQKFSRKGELDAKVANIPLNVFYNDQKLQDGLKGDRDMLKSWLNDDENRIYRTIKGKI